MATKWFHLHSGDSFTTLILLCLPIRPSSLKRIPQQSLLSNPRPPSSSPRMPCLESTATSKLRRLYCVLPALCLSQYSNVELWNLHQQSPWQTISIFSSTPRWSPVFPLTGSIRTSGISDVWRSTGSWLSRILLSLLISADSASPTIMGFYNLEICWTAIVQLHVYLFSTVILRFFSSPARLSPLSSLGIPIILSYVGTTISSAAGDTILSGFLKWLISTGAANLSNILLNTGSMKTYFSGSWSFPTNHDSRRSRSSSTSPDGSRCLSFPVRSSNPLISDFQGTCSWLTLDPLVFGYPSSDPTCPLDPTPDTNEMNRGS